VNGELILRDARPADAPALADIYNHYVETTVATFEVDAVSPATMAERIAAVQAQELPWLVLASAEGTAGYAYASAWKPRAAYARTVESTVYVAPGMSRRGFGRRLGAALLERLRAAGVHAVLAGVALPNAASVAMHEALGYRHVATLREVGFKHGRWVDVGYWQHLL
jgi:phosphinothricin acetyltransferase